MQVVITLIVQSEGLDRYEITLPGVQEDLIQAIAETGTPYAVVLINGGALAIGNISF